METIRLKYLFHLSSLYGNQMPWRNLQTIVLPREFLHFYIIQKIVRICDVDRFPPKTVINFPKNFHNFMLGAIEKQSIINFSHNWSKSYISVVLGDSEVTFLRKGEDVAFCPSLYCIAFICGIAKSKKVIKFPSHPYFWGCFIKASCFLAFNFCQCYFEFLSKLF